MKTNLPYLFIYKNYKIHNTTNVIDGGDFSPMKKLLTIPNGFTKNLKLKIQDDYLVSYKKNNPKLNILTFLNIFLKYKQLLTIFNFSLFAPSILILKEYNSP